MLPPKRTVDLGLTPSQTLEGKIPLSHCWPQGEARLGPGSGCRREIYLNPFQGGGSSYLVAGVWSDGTFPAAIKGVYRKVIQIDEEAFFFFSLWQLSLFHETPLKIYLVSYCSIKWESIYYLHLTDRSWQKQKIRLCLYRYVFLSDYILDIFIYEVLASASCPVIVLSKRKRGRGRGRERERERGKITPEADRSTDTSSCAPSWSLDICFMRMLDMAKNSPSSSSPLELLWV